MKIKTVGTGSITAVQRSSCTLVDDRILIDCGNGIVKTLLEQSVCIEGIEVLCVTHLHGDHFMDIPFLIMQRCFTNAKGKLDIYGPIGMTDAIDKLFTICFPDVEDWTVFKSGGNVELFEFDVLNQKEVANGFYITSLPVVHGDCPAFAFLVQNVDKTVGLSGDSSYCDTIDQLMEKSDAVILDTTRLISSITHMGMNDLQLLSQIYENKLIITTHMDTDLRKEVIASCPQNVIVPEDGQIIII